MLTQVLQTITNVGHVVPKYLFYVTTTKLMIIILKTLRY